MTKIKLHPRIKRAVAHMKSVKDRPIRSARDVKLEGDLKEAIETANVTVPMIARFGKDLAIKLLEMGFVAPEQLLFTEPQSLNLTKAETAIVGKYQRRFLPKPLATPRALAKKARRLIGINLP